MPSSIYFYPETIRNLTVALMDIFNNIKVRRFDTNKITVLKEFVPPIRFGPADSIYMQRKASENCDNYYLTFPRFSMEWTSMDYAEDRANGSDALRKFYDPIIGLANMDDFWSDVNPTPYDFGFMLHIKTNNFNDFLQIIEQIYPFFDPDLYLRIKEFSFLNIERDIQVTIGSLSPDFLQEVDTESKRYINADIPITCKGFLMRPISTQKIIKHIVTRFNILQDEDTYFKISETSTFGTYVTSAVPPLEEWEYNEYAGDYESNSISAFSNVYNFSSTSAAYEHVDELPLSGDFEEKVIFNEELYYWNNYEWININREYLLYLQYSTGDYVTFTNNLRVNI